MKSKTPHSSQVTLQSSRPLAIYCTTLRKFPIRRQVLQYKSFKNVHEWDRLAIYVEELSASAPTNPSLSIHLHTGPRGECGWWALLLFFFLPYFKQHCLHLCQLVLRIHRKHCYHRNLWVKMYELLKMGRCYQISC